MALRSPADTSTPNYRGCDWYEPWRGKTAQSPGGIPQPGQVNSAQVYGHGTWDDVNGVYVPGTPYMAEYPE